MPDLKALAESILREYLIRQSAEAIAVDLMADDPECQLLTDDEWDKVAEMIVDAHVDVRVVVR